MSKKKTLKKISTLEHVESQSTATSVNSADEAGGFGQVTAISYIEGNYHASGALVFGTSLGYLNFVLAVSEDMSRSTNRVETFILKG